MQLKLCSRSLNGQKNVVQSARNDGIYANAEVDQYP
jgi:hypothetical protein